MNEVLVQIRLPKSLLENLKNLPSSAYYLDQSELVRSLIRDAWIKQTKPELFEMQKLRQDIIEELKDQSAMKIRKEMVAELEKIKQLIKKEDVHEEK